MNGFAAYLGAQQTVETRIPGDACVGARAAGSVLKRHPPRSSSSVPDVDAFDHDALRVRRYTLNVRSCSSEDPSPVRSPGCNASVMR